jgi:uncharacterized protein YceK
MLKIVLILIFAFYLSACGSLRTVTKSNFEIGYDLYKNRTKCESTTRVYSGVTYDFCRFNSEPKGSTYNGFIYGAFFLDLIFISPIVDTMLLPVTIYQQTKYGNPEVFTPKR